MPRMSSALSASISFIRVSRLRRLAKPRSKANT